MYFEAFSRPICPFPALNPCRPCLHCGFFGGGGLRGFSFPFVVLSFLSFFCKDAGIFNTSMKNYLYMETEAQRGRDRKTKERQNPKETMEEIERYRERERDRERERETPSPSKTCNCHLGALGVKAQVEGENQSPWRQWGQKKGMVYESQRRNIRYTAELGEKR